MMRHDLHATSLPWEVKGLGPPYPSATTSYIVYVWLRPPRTLPSEFQNVVVLLLLGCVALVVWIMVLVVGGV